jgi:midasin (ATPase involved in ribosome maturation)
MNPPTDFGKKALLPAIRHRFSEIYVSEMDDPDDLKLIVGQHLHELPQVGRRQHFIVWWWWRRDGGWVQCGVFAVCL